MEVALDIRVSTGRHQQQQTIEQQLARLRDSVAAQPDWHLDEAHLFAPALAGPTYNAAPSQAQLTILNDHPQAIVRATWGFVPAWADGRPDVKPLINARAETVATKPFFRDAFKHKRCLILADGFYEWKRAGKSKVPYRIALQTEEPFAFAGIWSLVHDAQGRVQPTFAILTTDANPLVSQMHPRMPVILREQDEEEWLTPTLSLDAAQALLRPYPAERLMAYEVSPQVNSATSNSPDLLQPRAPG